MCRLFEARENTVFACASTAIDTLGDGKHVITASEFSATPSGVSAHFGARWNQLLRIVFVEIGDGDLIARLHQFIAKLAPRWPKPT